MDTKQKSLLVLTIAALGFLGYQVFQLVDRDITETPVIAEQKQTTQVAMQQPVSAPAATTTAVQSSVATQPVAATAAPTAQQPTIDPQQHAYMKELNNYELARMHHQLLDEEAAIATAQQKIAVMHNKTQKITGADGVTSDDSLVTGQAADAYVLSYVDKQNGEWSATLHLGSDYQSVEIGSQLPDGYQVIGIDHQGVTLQKNDHRELISFNGTVQLPTPAHPIVSQTALLAPHQQPQAVAQSLKLTHGALGEQANLLAQQLVHQGVESQAVARHGLNTVAPQPALAQGKPVMPQLDARHTSGLPYQISVHDANADEGEDDLANQQLSMDLHLRSMEIMPVVSQAYNTDSYLPQTVSIPRAYHLAGDSAVDDEQQFSSESSDDQATAINKADLSRHKVMTLPSQYYTIQLLGSADDTIINQFINKNELEHIALRLSVGTEDHPWVIALYGVYPSFDQAEEKLVHLPANMRMGGAWIRRIGDVQHILRGRAE